MRIWKYELKITDQQLIQVGSQKVKPLAVAEQNGKLMMWVQVDEDCTANNSAYAVCVDIAGTGNSYNATGDYLGSVIMSNGLVWHVFVDVLKQSL